MRNLVVILGDQLSHELTAWKDFDPQQDVVWMAELDEEATRVWSHKTRLVLFFSAMRHFRDELLQRQYTLHYDELQDDPALDQASNFAESLRQAIQQHEPTRVILTQPGDWSVLAELREVCEACQIPLELREDSHFYCSIADFSEWSTGKKSLILENFYRWMRKRHRVLVDKQGKPLGGKWNYDHDNRKTFGKQGPADIPAMEHFPPDPVTQQVMQLVENRYAKHPGSCDEFGYPVTSQQSIEALQSFVEQRLPAFGDYQDAMWTDTEFLYHSRLSAVMNMHMLSPFQVVNAAIDAYELGNAPLNCVEGFVRQVLGWREFVRGVYWTLMPEYIERNELGCQERDVPESYWNGQSDMNCIRQAMQPVVRHAYAHHIQRLMILGLFAQLLGVHPRKFHDWHMAMYADAVDWVSLPNTLGMSQHADGGVVGTKPYCASGNYVSRMSNYCQGCAYDPKKSTGDQACPITTLYWDFLDRHRDQFSTNGRMLFQMKNLENKSVEDLVQIRKRAQTLIESIAPLTG